MELKEQLKQVRQCKLAYRFLKGVSRNGGETTNAEKSFLIELDKVKMIASEVNNYDDVLVFEIQLLNKINNEKRVSLNFKLLKEDFNLIKKMFRKYDKSDTVALRKIANKLK